MKLRQHNDPILRTVCQPVDNLKWASQFAKQMIAAAQKNRGCGLAAPQAGQDVRLMVIEHSAVGWRWLANPVIDSVSNERETKSEGCLSFPGVSALIERATQVTVTFDAFDGRRTETFTGMDARIFLHEYDHLDGICQVGDEWQRQQERRAEQRRTSKGSRSDVAAFTLAAGLIGGARAW